MTIPAPFLNRWAAYPGPARSAAAHAKVRAALEATFRATDLKVDVYLQGSYRNYVNTKSDSDVDIVAELTSVGEFDTTHLSPWEAQRFWADMRYVDFGYREFRSAVSKGLVNFFGGAVEEHKKVFDIRGNLLRMKVDVLSAVSYHQVISYDGTNYHSHHGVAFWVDGRRIVNWPQLHFDHGVAKNQLTNERFKPSVRMFKNAQSTAVQRSLLEHGVSTSYFLQSLLWNVPNDCFVADLGTTYSNVLTWLTSNRDAHNAFLCQNGVDRLFGPGQWDLISAFRVESALIDLWNTWS